jgi:hypothetical protein
LLLLCQHQNGNAPLQVHELLVTPSSHQAASDNNTVVKGILTDVVSQRAVPRSHRQQKKNQSLLPTNAELFRFFVSGMLAAAIAELRELKPASGRLLVLRCRVIALLAFRALKSNYFTH